MKKIIVLVILVFGVMKIGSDHTLPNIYRSTTKSQLQGSHFLPAYERMRKWEGNYAWLEHDKGGETYGGIARYYNKNWEGWKLIDEHRLIIKLYKGKVILLKEKLPWNSKIDKVENHVLDFYLEIWEREKFSEIISQEIANYIFDFRNSGIGSIYVIQRVLNELEQKVNIDGEMGEETIQAINSVDPVILLIKLRDTRIQYYQKIVLRNHTQKVFLIGWKRRAEDIG